MIKTQSIRCPTLGLIAVMAIAGVVTAGEEPASGRSLEKKERVATERILRKEVVVSATPEQVWQSWTTEEGIARFFSPQSKIELRIGGEFGIYFNGVADETGKRGAEGSQILSYIPNELLAFDWGFPPKVSSLRRSGAKTQVILRFEDLGDGTVKVKLAQLGWQNGENWNQGYEYFDQAWSRVLGRLKAHLEKERSSGNPASGASRAVANPRIWTDGHVKVTSVDQPEKRQDFEMEIPVPAKSVWRMLATTEGFKKLGGKDPLVELKPGGAYSFWPGAPNKVLAFVPNEVLSTSGSAPPQFPNVRKGGTWGVYFLDQTGESHTRLRLSVLGWRPGEKEWDDAYDYFLKNNPVFLNQVYDALVKDRHQTDAGDVLRSEGIVEAPLADVWASFTTKEGIESWMVPHAEIELRVGGKMLTHYDPKGVIGDENTIENTILSYEPLRMISIKATKAPATFPFKAQLDRMWSVIRLEPVGSNQTRIIVTGMGYGDDEESQKMRKHFEWGNAYTVRKLQEHFAAHSVEASGRATKKGNTTNR